MSLSRFERSEDSPGFLLWQLTNLWQQHIRAALAPLELTHVQFVLLASIAWLEQSGDYVNQAMLARHAHTDVMMTSQVLRALEQKGLITRAVHPSDTRAKVITLTEDGRVLAQQAMKVVESVDARFFDPLHDQGANFLSFMQLLVQTHQETRDEP